MRFEIHWIYKLFFTGKSHTEYCYIYKSVIIIIEIFTIE